MEPISVDNIPVDVPEGIAIHFITSEQMQVLMFVGSSNNTFHKVDALFFIGRPVLLNHNPGVKTNLWITEEDSVVLVMGKEWCTP
jgi:hypothetical protein